MWTFTISMFYFLLEEVSIESCFSLESNLRPLSLGISKQPLYYKKTTLNNDEKEYKWTKCKEKYGIIKQNKWIMFIHNKTAAIKLYKDALLINRKSLSLYSNRKEWIIEITHYLALFI